METLTTVGNFLTVVFLAGCVGFVLGQCVGAREWRQKRKAFDRPADL
jgi:hypothetical protein